MFTGILFTLLAGLFFLIGILLLKYSSKKEALSLFTIALASVVMFGLLVFDLLKELISTKNILLVIPVIMGFSILIFLDKLIPHHHHDHKIVKDDKLDHEMHLNHIGIITILALTVHNMLEGLTLYSVTLTSIKSGLLMMISISLHNIPLGFQIGNSLEKHKYSKFLIILLCLSAFLGALIMIIFGNLNENIINILLALTFGMLLYILIFELLNEIRHSLKTKMTIYGIMLGIVILIITYII